MAQTRTTTRSKASKASNGATPAAAPEQGTDFSFSDIAIGEAGDLPKAVRAISPNPLEKAVRDGVDKPARYLQVPNGDKAKEAEGYLRRAGNENEWTVRVRYTNEEDKPLPTKEAHASTKPVYVYFSVSSDREGRAYAARRYTNKDIREHFKLDDKAKITPELRAQFRTDKGYDQRNREQ